MNKVPIIRKGTIKSYLKPGVISGIIFGIIGFIVNIDNLKTALIGGVVFFITMLFIFALGFFSEEYFKRKCQLNKMYSQKFIFLLENGFTIHSNLYFEGRYSDYFFYVFPMTKIFRRKKNIDYVVIETYYTSNNEQKEIIKKEELLSSNYFIGSLVFNNHCVGLIPTDYESLDFKECFDNIIRIMRQENFYPISKNDWEKLYKENKIIN
jgi:hypothetical protein